VCPASCTSTFFEQQACWCLLHHLNKAQASLQPGHERISASACSTPLFSVTAPPDLPPRVPVAVLQHPRLFPVAEPVALLAPLLTTDPSRPPLGAS